MYEREQESDFAEIECSDATMAPKARTKAKCEPLHSWQTQLRRAMAASSASTAYLIAYNAACVFAWAYILQLALNHIRDPTAGSIISWLPDFWHPKVQNKLIARSRTAYASFGKDVRLSGTPKVLLQGDLQVQWVQTAAILEPIHVALGLVRTSLGTTLAQVFSRLLIVYGVLQVFPE
jgi:very-long-chain (3R)-3-hydroxyacyl-CoA dehydratase